MEKKKLVAIISPDDIQAILLADDGSLIHLRVVALEKWVTLNEDGSHIDDDDYIGLTISEGYLDQCNDFANFLGFWDAKLGTATPDDFTHEIGRLLAKRSTFRTFETMSPSERKDFNELRERYLSELP